MKPFQPNELRLRAEAAQWTVIGAFLILVTAFFRTQIIQHDRYQLRATNNRLRALALPSPRGAIYDRYGRVIAENVPGFSVRLLAPSEDSLRAVLKRFVRIVPLESEQMEEAVRRYRQATFQPALILGDASFEMVSRLEEHRVQLPGLVIQSEPKRYYPDRKAVAHLVGYVTEVTEADLASNRYPGARLGTLVGKAGIEQQYDDRLRGSPGVRYIEVNALGRLVREEGAAPELPPQSGDSLRTTIDLTLQRYVDSIWPVGVRGAMVAMTPRGEILAMYSAPSYDPNEFIGGISGASWKALNDDPARPLLNRAIQARYPPASSFKLAIATMALKRGLVNFSSRMPEPCRGGLLYGNRYFRCWKKEGHGSLDLTGAIVNSCDVYFYQLGLRLQLANLLSEGAALGFREKSGVDLRSEVNPVFPSSVAYFDRVYGPRNWSNGVTLNLAIGQGENAQTVMNMMRFYEALASDGVGQTPYIVQPAEGRPLNLGLTPVQLDGLRQALLAVVEKGTGAASRHRDLTVGGKTGTAQNPHGKDHGWFIGFAPVDAPEIIVGGIMEFAEHGTAVAPYVVRIIRRFILGPDSAAPAPVRLITPEDSAPRAFDLNAGGPPEPAIPDSFLLPPPPDSVP